MSNDKYTLFDRGNPMSSHPNREGARLSSLFHVKSGEKVWWLPEEKLPEQVASDWGFVGRDPQGKDKQLRFKILRI